MDFCNNLKLVITFDYIKKDYIDNLINSMPRRLEVVIAAESGNTKY